jgi:hypothetical protein
VPAGKTFECYLQDIGKSEAQYNRKVIENVVYVAMAERHMPQQGDADARSQGYMSWICATRRNYDVQPKLSFIVKENQPCTSGLPSDVPLPGLDGTPQPEVPPEPVETVGPSTPASTGQQTPQPTRTRNPDEPTPMPTEPETITAP